MYVTARLFFELHGFLANMRCCRVSEGERLFGRVQGCMTMLIERNNSSDPKSGTEKVKVYLCRVNNAGNLNRKFRQCRFRTRWCRFSLELIGRKTQTVFCDLSCRRQSWAPWNLAELFRGTRRAWKVSSVTSGASSFDTTSLSLRQMKMPT